jgi:hypothetical protein
MIVETLKRMSKFESSGGVVKTFTQIASVQQDRGQISLPKIRRKSTDETQAVGFAGEISRANTLNTLKNSPVW